MVNLRVEISEFVFVRGFLLLQSFKYLNTLLDLRLHLLVLSVQIFVSFREGLDLFD